MFKTAISTFVFGGRLTTRHINHFISSMQWSTQIGLGLGLPHTLKCKYVQGLALTVSPRSTCTPKLKNLGAHKEL